MKSIIFDLDGTLLDTASFAVEALREAVNSVNLDTSKSIVLPSDDTICRSFGLPISIYYKALLKPWSGEIEDSVHQRAISLQCHMLSSGKARLYDGVVKLLCRLRHRGFAVVVVSCASRAYLDAVRSHLLPAQYVDTWISTAEHSTDNKIAVMREFVSAVGAEPLAVVGDRLIDVVAARYVGAIAIGCLYGYGAREEIISADHLTKSSVQMAEIVLRLTR